MNLLEDWYGGDPSANGFSRVCCIDKGTDIKRLYIDTICSFDHSKWDLIKSLNKEELSEISSNCASSMNASPLN